MSVRELAANPSRSHDVRGQERAGHFIRTSRGATEKTDR
jgi:hypothetical protein